MHVKIKIMMLAVVSLWTTELCEGSNASLRGASLPVRPAWGSGNASKNNIDSSTTRVKRAIVVAPKKAVDSTRVKRVEAPIILADNNNASLGSDRVDARVETVDGLSPRSWDNQSPGGQSLSDSSLFGNLSPRDLSSISSTPVRDDESLQLIFNGGDTTQAKDQASLELRRAQNVESEQHSALLDTAQRVEELKNTSAEIEKQRKEKDFADQQRLHEQESIQSIIAEGHATEATIQDKLALEKQKQELSAQKKLAEKREQLAKRKLEKAKEVVQKEQELLEQQKAEFAVQQKEHGEQTATLMAQDVQANAERQEKLDLENKTQALATQQQLAEIETQKQVLADQQKLVEIETQRKALATQQQLAEIETQRKALAEQQASAERRELLARQKLEEDKKAMLQEQELLAARKKEQEVNEQKLKEQEASSLEIYANEQRSKAQELQRAQELEREAHKAELTALQQKLEQREASLRNVVEGQKQTMQLAENSGVRAKLWHGWSGVKNITSSLYQKTREAMWGKAQHSVEIPEAGFESDQEGR